jgi:thioredoxin reductase (NADPH)
MSTFLPVIIIGSGPAGLTAAIYTARAGLRPVVLAGHMYGGQLMLTTEVENYPGFPNGIMGPELMEGFRAQAERFGAVIHNVEVTDVNFTEPPFSIKTAEETYQAQTVIIATGASARWLNIPGEARLRGRGVSSCATCDGPFFTGKHITVVGGGDSAMEEALFLTRFARELTVLHRSTAFKASKIMLERVRTHPKIHIRENSIIEEVLGDQTVSGINFRHVLSGQRDRLSTDALFVAIGHDPNTTLFTHQLALDKEGYIFSSDGVHTSTPGVFVAGDVYDRRYRQAITAAGSGCKAAIEVEKYLETTAI